MFLIVMYICIHLVEEQFTGTYLGAVVIVIVW